MPRHKAVLIALLCLTTKAKRRGMTGKLSRHTSALASRKNAGSVLRGATEGVKHMDVLRKKREPCGPRDKPAPWR
ncbi:hypothetical protein [Ectopseudomonas alcaliphila]|uniref:hypothetical protein n=1 Tax=Ectopseudomonas alcaliphila TaxID=101564 RepID=UPI00278335BC|nr:MULTISPECIES: hypothetical protein [Pseudomonas]MDP9939301.1 hypothetical protein [Pseudomonas sp. 3400]MDR7011524.1 hypothetical protein [Pseudomonas alcaliphila]